MPPMDCDSKQIGEFSSTQYKQSDENKNTATTGKADINTSPVDRSATLRQPLPCS